MFMSLCNFESRISDYGIKKTRVSYIHSQLGQAPNYANTNHIIDWPGQSALERNFPTMDVMLIPGYVAAL